MANSPACGTHLAEFGIVAAKGLSKAKGLIAGLGAAEIPELARMALRQIAGQIDACDKHIDALEAQIVAWHRADESSRNLATIPGIGPITASAIAASVPDPTVFDSNRKLAAWLELVPRQNSTGGKNRLGSITKAGDSYKMFAFITEFGFDYVILIRGNIHVTAADGEKRTAAEWVGAGGKARKLTGTAVTATLQPVRSGARSFRYSIT